MGKCRSHVLEKCRQFLYQEFVLGNIAREQLPDGREVGALRSGDDLIIKTPGFFEYVARDRIDKSWAPWSLCRGHFQRPEPVPVRDPPANEFLRRTSLPRTSAGCGANCYSLSERVRRAA